MKLVNAAATVAVVAAVACSPAEHPHPGVVMREGNTVRTSCGDDPPELYAGSLDVTKPWGTRIDRICWYGMTDETHAKVEPALGFRVGDKLTEDAIRPAMDRLMALKLLDDVSIGAEQRGDGAVVYVEVHELSRVDEVVFDGEKIEPAPFAVGATVNPRSLAAAATKIRDRYIEQSYGGAKVDITSEPTTPGHVRLRCAVAPGPQWRIKKTVFTGTARVSETDLRGAIAIPVGRVYDADIVDVADMRIMDVFYNHGLINAKVSEPARDVAADGGVTLTWKVDEGDVYTVGAVKLPKTSKQLHKQVAAAVSIKPKSVFNRSEIPGDVLLLAAAYEQAGKHVIVTPSIKVDDKKKTVDITFDVVEGK